MDSTPVMEAFRMFFYKGFEILMPVLLVSFAVVLIMAVIMAVMQIQEQTLTFLPKMVAFVAVLYVLGPWMFDELITLILEHIERIPSML